MQGLAHRIAARTAAALVALALGGVVPWLEAPHDEAPHRCQCPRGAAHHDCDCPICHAEALRPAAAGESRVPPCHLALARAAREAERDSARRRAAGGPLLSSTCGTGDHRFDPPPSQPLFTVPVSAARLVQVAVTPLDVRVDVDLGLAAEPETPPPRRA